MAYRVLVVDDSPAMRTVVERAILLSALPVDSCFTAENGNKALAVLSKNAVDVVITDLNMPVMDGEELVRRIRQDPKLRRIPLLVISADATTTRVQRMLDLGISAYLPKPFAPEALVSEVGRTLEQHHDAK